MMEFYDAVTPGNVPAGAHACLYADGLYKASAKEAERFTATRWITVEGGAAAAANAGIADFEPENPVFDVAGRLREWAQARLAMNCRARVYSDLTNLPAVHAQVGDLENVVFWLALYGEPLTGAQLAKRAGAEPYRVSLDPPRIWGHQYAGGPTAAYDLSVLIGTW